MLSQMLLAEVTALAVHQIDMENGQASDATYEHTFLGGQKPPLENANPP